MKNTRNEKDRSGERGVSMVVSILSLLLVTLLGVALMSMGMTGRTIAINDVETTEAFFVAESGMEHGLKLITTLGHPNFSNILANGVDNDPWDNLTNGDTVTTITDPIAAAGQSLTGTAGTYRISVTDDNDSGGNPLVDTNGRIIVRAQGTGRNGATTTIEVLFGSVPIPGVLVDGNLRINGNPDILGVGGAVHSNGTMDIDGSPCAEHYFSSASNIVDQDQADTGPGCNGNDVRPSSPIIPVPDFNIANWATDPLIPDPDFIFRSDGTVLKKIGQVSGATNNPGATYNNPVAGYALIGAACTGSNCSGDFSETLGSIGEVKWSFDGSVDKKEWKLSGNGLHGGRTYYFQGSNLAVSGSPGSNASHVVATFLADGYINMSGNPFLTPKADYVQMMAGNDLEINGNLTGSDTNFHGLHYARHQIKFSGNPVINGQVIAKNQGDSKFPSPNGINLVPLLQGGFMDMSGNPVITYDGMGQTTVLRIMSWREVRN